MTTNFNLPYQEPPTPRFPVNEFRRQEPKEPLSEAATHQMPVDSKRRRIPMLNQNPTDSGSLFSLAQTLCKIHPYVAVSDRTYSGIPYVKDSGVTVVDILKKVLGPDGVKMLGAAFSNLNESQIKDAVSYLKDFVEAASRLKTAGSSEDQSIRPLKGIFAESGFFDGFSESIAQYWQTVDRTDESD